MTSARGRYPIGAELIGAESVSLRVWAPRWKRVAVVENGDSSAELKLGAEGNGYFRAHEQARVPVHSMAFALTTKRAFIPIRPQAFSLEAMKAFHK